MKCKHCNGTGYDQWSFDRTCAYCKGSGKLSIWFPVVVVIILLILLVCVKLQLI